MNHKLILTSTFFLVAALAVESVACTCGQQSLEEALIEVDVLFVGKVIAISQKPDTLGYYTEDDRTRVPYVLINQQISYTLVVSRYFKGKLESDTVSVMTGKGGGDCGYSFQIGEEYIVFGYNPGKNTVNTSICTPTKPKDDNTVSKIETMLD